MTQKSLSKFLAGLLGAFIGLSLTAVAQVPGPINLRGIGGDSIQQVEAPSFGSGGTFSYVPELGIASCSGCTTYMQGSYVVHAFSTIGNTHTFTAPTGLTGVEVVIIGGGGGGGGDRYGGGGGGAGGYVNVPSQAVTPNTPLNVTVGDGGAGGIAANGKGQDGAASSFGGTVANGGGGGGAGNQTTTEGAGNNGGSGGGGGARDSNTGTTQPGGTGNQGNNGAAGTRSATDDNNRGGGGGGAGGDGTAGINGNGGQGGSGGQGVDLSAAYGTAFGVAGWFAGGGGGGKRQNGTGGPGGQGGGGTGGIGDNVGGNALDGTGGGGGGAGGDNADRAGGDGGSGIVLVRYIPQPTGAMRAVHVFTSVGTTQFVAPAGLTSVDVLVVGGGGGGGGVTSGTADIPGGGGGGGGYRYVAGQAITNGGTYNVTVGAGGSAGVGGTSDGGIGGDSAFGTLVRSGGGGGGASDGVGGNAGGNGDTDGASGGGGRAGSAGGTASGGAGVGNAGGGSSTTGGGGGGGGPQFAGSAGAANVAASGGAGGNAGYGSISAISGTAVAYGGGGGGGAYSSGGSIAGGLAGPGLGGGGAGGSSTSTTNRQAGSAGTANTGGGGGGGSGSSGNSATAPNGGAGGSGIVVISYVPPTTTYITHTFTTTGDSSFTPPPGVTSVELLVVGGGGGGGSRHGGGGGGGGVVHHTNFAVTPGNSYNVTVGAGGTSSETSPTTGSVGTNGQASDFANTVIALGGGGGGSYTAPVPTGGGSGGGGGGSDNNTAGTGDGAAGNRNGGLANQTNSGGGTGYGSAGGNGAGTGTNNPANFTGGGGGGGAGGTGALAVGHIGGAGGVGFQTNFTGTLSYFGGGGGGGSGGAVANVAAGGQGGGGAGGSLGAPGTAGTANTGGGGGGSRSDGPGGTTASRGGAGGAGVVIVRYRPPTMTITQQPSTQVDTGLALATQPQVTLQTYNGTPISGVNVTAGIQSGTGTLGGTTTVATNGSGVAAFTNLSLTGTAGNFLLDFNAANATGETVSNAISLQNYYLKILHATNYATCLPSTPITLEVRRTNGTLVSNYAGTVTLTNSGNHGDYSLNTGAGTIGSQGGNNGDVTYTFAGADGGDAILNFTTAVAGNLVFDASGPGGIADDNTSGVLDVGLCEFRFSHDGSGTTCAADTITLGIYDENGALIPSYAGTVQLSTSTNQGAWALNSGAGTLTPGGGDGTASYTFAGGDGGDVALNFLHTGTGAVDFEAVAGLIEDNESFSPDLDVTACSNAPGFSQVCAPSNSVDIAITAQTPYSNRLLIVAVGRDGALSGSATPPGTTQTFNGAAMTQVATTAFQNAASVDAMSEMFMMSETTANALPTAAGTYTVQVSSLGTNTFTCAFFGENMAQDVPATPENADITNTTANPDTTTSTSLSTPADNSIVFAALLGTNDVTSFTGATAPLTTRNYSENGAASTFTVSSGVIPSAGAITATNVSLGNIDRRSQVAAAFAPAPPELAHFRISHAGNGGTCAPNTVTITAVDQYGSTVTNYTGTVTLTAGGSGSWSQGTATNAPVNGLPGAATYTFHASDQGMAQLAYANTAAGAVDIDVVAGLIQESPFFDAALNLQACEMRMSHAGADGSTCAINTVTLGVYTPGPSGVRVNYTGTVTLNTVLVPGPGGGGGDWSVIDGAGSFNNGTANDGIATYQFTLADAGEVTLGFSKTAASTVNFNPVASGLTVASGYDANLVLTNCFFRISHDGSGDVCTPELVTISVVNGNGVQQNNYVGGLNLTTPTGSGDWSVANAVNAISNFGSGAASYTFADADDGDIQLYLRHHAISESGFVIGANSGAFGVQGGYNPTLLVAACTIRFSVLDTSAQTCSSTAVTLGIYNSGGTLATSYAGTIALTTSTGHGTWASADGPGALSNNTAGTGAASYTFVAGDAGDAVLQFTNDAVETLNFNANSAGLHPANAIVVDTSDSAYDPTIEVTACLPDVGAVACYPNQSQGNAITLPSSAQAQGSRMVLVYVGSESTTAATGVTFEGQLQTPTLLRTEAVNDGTGTLTLQVYGLLDAHLPANAGSYDVAFTGSANSPAMCIVSVTGVGQTFPQSATPATDGQLNGSVTASSTNRIETGVKALKNNSLVLGVALSNMDASSYYTNLDERMWAPGAADPNGADWVGDYEYQLVAGSTSAIHQNSGFSSTRRQAQIALTLDPVADGPPGAGHFVPVTLFETFSGHVDYVAIGNTLRVDGADPGSSVGACEIPAGTPTGTARALPLPADATVLAAYLYWSGSGTASDVDDQVRFGVDGDPRQLLTADKVFRIKPMKYDPALDPSFGGFGIVPESFFSAFKDVTGLITTEPGETYRFSDLAVRTDSVWAEYETCVAGWALVVVYEHAEEDLNVINLFHGFQPFWHSSLTLIPRNFRMATPDGIDRPHAQVTHVTFEGDTGTFDNGEVLGLQNDPGNLTFTNLTNSANPVDNQYNETVSYPLYDANLNFTGNYFSTADSWGADVDTYFVEGDDPGEHLYPFGALEAEQITTHYETGQDIVLLTAEFISVMNSPIADLEVFVDDSASFKVAQQNTASYTYSVVNNGDGASGGFASGDVILTGNMPTGISIDSIAADGWDCSLATTSAFTCVFEIADDWTALRGAATAGQLAMNETLPLVTVTVDIANETQFPLLNNTITTVARLAHVGDYTTCPAEPAGVQPNPNPVSGCNRAPQFDNKNDLNKFLIDVDDLDEKTATNNNVHHVDTNVRGIETNLGVMKTLVGILETNEPATYQITVTNSGPDATTKVMTVADTLPAGLVPASASGTGWSCGIASQTVTCTRSAALAVGATTPPITIVTNDIVAPAVEGSPVSNTATVAAGQYNFDSAPGNDFYVRTATVTGPLAASNEKFLLSVTEDGSTIGGLEFNEGDLVIYDPVADEAEMYIEELSIPGVTDLGDIDAVHLLPNGQVLLSTATDGSSINGLTFNAEDIVLYDPLLHTVTLVFDGSAIFTSDSADIDAIHVLYNDSYTPTDWDLVFSTAGTATIGALTFEDNDIVTYDMGSGTATLRADGSDDDLFGGSGGDISALHLRHTDSDIYVVSTSDAQATIGISGENQEFERGELVEIDLNVPDSPETDPLFCDDVTPCVGAPPAIFTPASLTRRLDAVHVIESGYMGHFAISSSGGDVCTQTQVTIRKHAGLTHVTEAHYRGSIIISNGLDDGDWVIDSGADGDLVSLGSDTGRAMYTFAASDAGEVVLYITGTAATNALNIDIRTVDFGNETATRENAPSEDPNILIGQLVTEITYADEFGSVAYTNNDGAAQFAGAWSEVNDEGTPGSGKIQIAGNQLRFNNFGGGGAPELIRQIDFGAYGVEATPTLTFDYTILGSPTGTFVAEARGDDNDGWTQLWSTSATSGSGTSGALSFTGLDLSATTQIRFRIVSGYSTGLPTSQYIAIDNVIVATETNDCGVGGSVDHYAITHDDTMLSCLAELVTITPHAPGDLVVEPGLGTVITLQTSTNKGFWGPPIDGNGAFATPATDNGFATYTYLAGETALTFPFYYTELADDVDPNVETVTINVADNSVPSKFQLENSTLTVARTGLRFFNETANSEQFPALVSGMPSSVYPAQVLTVQAVRSSDADPAVCQPAFADGADELIELAFECADSAACSAATLPVQVTNNSNTVNVEPVSTDNTAGVNTGGFVSMPLRFTTNGSFSRAVIALNYGDAGAIQIHGRHNLVVEDQEGDALNSNDYMVGSGDTFVVRPFAFDIDFALDRDNSNGDCAAATSCAADASGSVFAVAGAGFSTTVRAVAWQAADDDSNANGDVANDGVPDSDADLFDNATTPNFGNEANAAEDNVTLTHALAAAMPMGSVNGALADNTFTDFGAGGMEAHTLRYSEVGIIDLVANLDTNDYLGGQQGVTGRVRNVGRFIPADFTVTAPMLTARPLFAPSAADFTYMGEEFTVAFTLTARNAAGATTENYFGDFAKLTSPAQFNFRAVSDGGAASDTSYSTRLAKTVTGPNPIPADFEGDWSAGVVMLDGNLVFERLADQTPDGPFGPLKIAVRVTDADGVFDVDRDVTEDEDACNADCMVDPKQAPSSNLIGEHEFRYGRIRLENAYGSDIADLDESNDPIGRDVLVRLVAEYFDGAEFISNAEDIATPYDSAELSFVPGTYTDALDDGEAAITSMDEPGIVYRGETMETSGQDDVPMYLRAPGEGNDGTVLIELDLDALGLSFLKFDWRDGSGTGEDAEADVKADPEDYSTPDNPRGFVEFGNFRGNDRIINWQELFE